MMMRFLVYNFFEKIEITCFLNDIFLISYIHSLFLLHVSFYSVFDFKKRLNARLNEKILIANKNIKMLIRR